MKVNLPDTRRELETLVGPLEEAQFEIAWLARRVSQADDSYGDSYSDPATRGQVTAINVMLSKIVGALEREHRLATLAFLCGYRVELFNTSRVLTIRGAREVIDWAYGNNMVDLHGSVPRDGARSAVIYAATKARFSLSRTRSDLKRAILAEDPSLKGDLHEIITWPGPGDKYGLHVASRRRDAWKVMAERYYVKELCCIIPNERNITTANGERDDLLRANMDKYGPDKVIQALRHLAELLDAPEAYIPASIDYKDFTIKILE